MAYPRSTFVLGLGLCAVFLVATTTSTQMPPTAYHAILLRSAGSNPDTNTPLNAFAYDINSHGRVVGAADVPDAMTGRPTRWNASMWTELGELTLLPPPPGLQLGTFNSVAVALNDNNTVVGTIFSASYPQGRAFVWDDTVGSRYLDTGMASPPAYSSAWTITADGHIFGQAGLPGEGGTTVATGVLFRDRQVAVNHCDSLMFRQCDRRVTAVYDVSEPVPSPIPSLVGGYRDLAGEVGSNLPLEFVYGSKFPRMAMPLPLLIAYGTSYVIYRADVDNYWQALVISDGGRAIATERHHFPSSLGFGPMSAIGVVRNISLPSFPVLAPFSGAMGDISLLRLGIGGNAESSWTHAVMDVNSHFQIVGGRSIAGEAHATVTDGYLRLFGGGAGGDTPTVDLNAATALPAGLTRLNAANGINERGWIAGSGYGSPGCGTACTTPSVAFVLIPTPETPSWAPPGAPLGNIDTPTAGAVTAGEVAFTGWAIDNSGLTGVDMYRAPLPGESTAPNGLVFVGTSVTVPGARPDVAAVYPLYPDVPTAGWGFMVLTNMLPNGGTGNFTLYAVARSREGESHVIGSRTIIAANLTSTRPFGTIDTPAQGQTVSGVVTNFGWALTPNPKHIPDDGSTIAVFIDGAFVGRPSYGHFRPDIAGLFPGYLNSNGAVGFFQFDSRGLSNGLHTIAWQVTDSAGVTSGMGSRFFRVQN